MKNNGNEKRVSDYYIGLDVGTNSIGWATTDEYYNILKYKGNSMWGVRLFDEAKTAEERRNFRTSRRLNHRKHQRLELLNLLFDGEISKTDPSFFIRLKESSLFSEDKSVSAKYPLFNDEKMTDKKYFKSYPTVYHLRKELINSQEPHDIRLVYLALHHILKNRGHFLFDIDTTEDYKTVDVLLDEFNAMVSEIYGAELFFEDKEKFIKILISSDISVTSKKKSLRETVKQGEENENINLLYAVDMLSGATVKFCDLFCDETLKNVEKKSLTLNSDIEADINIIQDTIGEERLDVIFALKGIYDSAKLANMLGNHKYISEAKVEQFEINKSDLSKLKKYVKEYAPEKYKTIFLEKKDKLNNYAAYSGKTLKSGEYSCKKQEDFCVFLLTVLPEMEKVEEYKDIYQKINNKTFLPKLKGSDNSVIPSQLHNKELIKILENASKYLSFLQTKDENGLTVSDKILSIFNFRIPYYVGPLNNKSPNSWVVRTDEKIYPWNFENIVDIKKSSEQFIVKLISKCTYTGDDVLPKESLLFSKYNVLNEINPLSVNGKNIPISVKQEIYRELFVNSSSKVTKKSIKAFLLKKGYIEATDEVGGIDDNIKSKLKSYHDFKRIIDVDSNTELVEDVIKAITIFGEDKKLLKAWLFEKYSILSKEQINAICRLKYKEWGSLSKTFLENIYHPDENGEARSIIYMLCNTNCNLMQLLSSDYKFRENADFYREEKHGSGDTIKKMIEDMYVSPAVKRSLLQTVKIVDEIVDIRKSAPKKIFIEVAREKSEKDKGKRTVSRKEKLIELYKTCKKEYSELFASLETKSESDLRQDVLYLYYTQFGKCMYSGEPIDIEKLKIEYDIDHIFPQSKIKDDSIDNRVLVKRNYNEKKGNRYPIFADWREKMKPYWYQLKEKGLISDIKYERLIRNTELTDAELSSFVERQLVETRQSTKALAHIMESLYKEAGTKIVYSKAGNVSDFRRDYNYVKCREVNDFHHAKDAYLNIVVGNVYDTKFTSKFFKNIRSENYSLNQVFNYPVKGAWEVEKSFETISKILAKNNILVTRKPYSQNGALFDLQILSAGKGQMETKVGKDISKYGGYNKIAGAYFCVVEHQLKKSRIRTIEPVYIYAQDMYEKTPLKYCADILNLSEPRIICSKVYIDQLFELDGKKLYICGRTGNQLLCKHDYQLVISGDDEKYIKSISKYVSRSVNEKCKEGIPLEPQSEISKEKNKELFVMFLKKISFPIYNRIFGNVSNTLKEKVDEFNNFSVYQQCVVLLEVLKLFKCDRQSSDLSLLGGAAKSGIILCNKSLAKVKSAFIINRSVTGLFETKIDLLK